jgi:prepilin-type N-terminal cleavage/methylation domain-containing protein
MRNDRGFTLVEVIVALTILVLLLTNIFGRLQFAVDTISDAEREAAATEAAETFLAELGRTRPLAYGVSEGDLPTGQHWRLLVSPVHERPPERPVGLPEGHNVSLTLSWPQHGRTVRLVFETLRLGVEL